MAFRIIPKLDIKNNYLVKGINMEGLEKIGNPLIIAEEYYNDGADEIVFHDCVASLYKKNNLADIIENFSKKIFIPLTVGGGVKSKDDVINILAKGADRISINSALFNDHNLLNDLVKFFGSSTICSNVEVQEIDEKYYVFKDFGRNNTLLLLNDWLKYLQDYGVGELIITSIANEGTQVGFDIKLIEKIEKIISVPVLIHGGCGSLDDIFQITKYNFISGVVISSILHNSKKEKYKELNSKKYFFEYKNDLTIQKIKNYLTNKKVEVNTL